MNTVPAGTYDELPAPADCDSFVVTAPPARVGLYVSDGVTWTIQTSDSLAGLSDVLLSGLADGDGIFYDSDTGKFLNAQPAGGGAARILPESRSSNTGALAVADMGKRIGFTAAFTQTFVAAATLANGWWIVLENLDTAGTVDVVLDPNGSETIDGLTTLHLYPGDTRIVICDGSNFATIRLSRAWLKATATTNFVAPSKLTKVDYDLVGAGGWGNDGAAGAGGSARPGGTGGGGGARSQGSIHGSQFTPGTTYSITVGQPGPNANVPGSTTTFRNAQAYCGGNGKAGAAGEDGSGGSGGGSGEFGFTGDLTPQPGGGHTTINGAAAFTPTFSQVGQGQCGGDSVVGSYGMGADWGGGAGGGVLGDGTLDVPTWGRGGTSNRGGGGGGAGGGVSAANAATGGAVGGNSGFYTETGGNGGGAGGNSSGGNGVAGADGTTANSGKGGGGGGGNAAGNGGNGGAGGVPGGGGGGGGGGTNGGAGGSGSRGEARIYF